MTVRLILRRADDDDDFAPDLGIPGIRAGESASSPRRTSSCSLVSSRQTAASRHPALQQGRRASRDPRPRFEDDERCRN